MKRQICKSCGAEIVWIRTSGGKSMPCDAEPVYYIQKAKGSKKVVTPNGEVLSCEYAADDLSKATGWGYAPHWGTCDKPDSFRKRGKADAARK